MHKDTPWNTDKRFSPDTSLLGNASIAKKLVEEHQLNNSGLQDGLQEFVDAVGNQARGAASIVNATTEGEKLKAQDRLTLNQVEQEDRQSLIEDLRVNTELSHLVRGESNRSLYLEANTLSLANQSHEMANTVIASAIELQAIKTEEQLTQIRNQIAQRVEQSKVQGNEGVKQKLANIRKRNKLQDTTGITYQKNIGGNGTFVDGRLGFPSSLIESISDVED